MLENVVDFVRKVSSPSFAFIVWSIMTVTFAIWKRHGGGIDAGARARCFALMAIPMGSLVALSGVAVSTIEVTKVFASDVAAAMTAGNRLDPTALVSFGTPQALAAFAATWRALEPVEFAQALLGAAIMLAGGSAAAIHVWRATSADLPAIRWRHAAVGAVVTLAVWLFGFHLGAGELGSARREAYRSLAELQTLRCPDLSTPCPLQRKPDGG